MSTKHIAIFMPSMAPGGAERVMIFLANYFVKSGIQVDIISGDTTSPYLTEVNEKARIIYGPKKSTIGLIPYLCKHLRQVRPDILFCTQNHINVAAILAKLILPDITLVIREANDPIPYYRDKTSIKDKLIKYLALKLYGLADGIVAVSKGVKKSMVQVYGLKAGKIQDIYNPIISQNIFDKAEEEVDHPWFQDESLSIVLAVSNIRHQKDHKMLIRAFSIAFKKVPQARLVILGKYDENGALYNELLEEVQSQSLIGKVEFMGFQSNPYKYMAKSDVFALSSQYEGLPGSLIQALALGNKIVSTDCPSGPAEVLDDGQYGSLIPVGDHIQFANALVSKLTSSQATYTDISQHLQKFSEPSSGQAYLDYFDSVLAQTT